MSSVARGSAFEDRVFAALDKELNGERLGLSPRSARIFKRKGYYSKDRDDQIIVDISIEVWLPDAPSWSLLWACECKDYSGTVPASDIEEFKSKLDQIAGVNKKGVIAVSGALQSSALKYARAHGIGVVRLLPGNQVKHVLHMAVSDSDEPSRSLADEALLALTAPAFVGVNRNLYAEVDGHIAVNWRSILSRALQERAEWPAACK